MHHYHYVWLTWSSAFLLPWLGLYLLFPKCRRVMVRASMLTAPFGLTEPLFVPVYWNPPSLFDLAQRTGFDIESLIFCFAIGGVCVVFYNVLAGRTMRPLDPSEKQRSRHRFHFAALLAPFPVFMVLYQLPWNPIYPAIISMAVGAMATMLCRPDLKIKTLVGGALFLVYYLAFMLALKWSAPGYIERVWNLPALSGVMVYGIPLEELLFGAVFGMYWSSIYEHMMAQRDVGRVQSIRDPT